MWRWSRWRVGECNGETRAGGAHMLQRQNHGCGEHTQTAVRICSGNLSPGRPGEQRRGRLRILTTGVGLGRGRALVTGGQCVLRGAHFGDDLATCRQGHQCHRSQGCSPKTRPVNEITRHIGWHFSWRLKT